jgi:glycosyltransferase involved in cell wall biosynthesis
VTGPQASVIVPTRDRRKSLGRALRSALWQQDVELEVIVVDDGSTDGTEAFIHSMGHPRVRLLRNDTPQGVSAGRNRGVAEARGEWIAFLDDDDVWAPDKLRVQLAALQARARGWAYGGEVIVDPELRVVDGSPPLSPEELVRALEHYNAVPAGASNVVVATDLLARVGPFDPRLSTSEDWDMWIRLSRAKLPACVPSPIVAVRLDHGYSRKMPTMLEELRVVARRHGVRVDWGRHYRWAAWEALRDGRRVEALRYYAGAIAAGDARSIARAIVALVAPGYADRRLRRTPRNEAWIAEAQVWLGALRSLEERA